MSTGNGIETVQFSVVTLFPQMLATVAGHGVVGRAIERELVALQAENPRDFADDVHRTVDDRPYGGGPGMVMKYEPVAAAIAVARDKAPTGSPVVCLTPQGKVFDQAKAREVAALPGLIGCHFRHWLGQLRKVSVQTARRFIIFGQLNCLA